jgi:hypothetical protein
MTEHDLDETQARSVFEMVRGKAMTKGSRRYSVEASLAGSNFHGASGHFGICRSAAR